MSIIERTDRREWDFSELPAEEEAACSHFEYARESEYLVQGFAIKDPITPGQGRNAWLSRLGISAAMYVRGPDDLRRPWRALPPEARESICSRLVPLMGGLQHHPWQKADPDHSFGLGYDEARVFRNGIDPEQVRTLNERAGVEAIVVSIYWRDFSDEQIVNAFRKWVASDDGRPPGIGLRKHSGNRSLFFRKALERLAVMRLAHLYPLDEIPKVLPPAWRGLAKFEQYDVMNAERRQAKKTLLRIFPFLPSSTVPKSWPKYKTSQDLSQPCSG